MSQRTVWTLELASHLQTNGYLVSSVNLPRSGNLLINLEDGSQIFVRKDDLIIYGGKGGTYQIGINMDLVTDALEVLKTVKGD